MEQVRLYTFGYHLYHHRIIFFQPSTKVLLPKLKASQLKFIQFIIICSCFLVCRRGTHFEREHDSLVAVSALWRCPERVMSQSNVSYVPSVSDVSYVSPSDTQTVLGSCSSYQSLLLYSPCQQSSTLSFLKQICCKCCTTIENGQLLLLLCPFYSMYCMGILRI